MNMTIKNISDYLEEIAPLNQAEDFDNVGLLIGNETTEVEGILVTLDTLEETVDEAIKKKCNLIVSFHPIIFSGLKKINGNSYVEKVVLKAIQNNIAIYATHTALDNSKVGVSSKMCEKLGLINYNILLPKEDGNTGMGMIGDLPKPMQEEDFLKFTKKTFKTNGIRFSNTTGNLVNKVAVLGGSGSFAIADAIHKKADVYISADFKYHDFFKAEGKILLIDVGHYESEQFTKNLLVEYLTKKFTSFAIILSEKSTNPIYYL
jgi:dinuclear metal center YbgI/SA1388 family protein